MRSGSPSWRPVATRSTTSRSSRSSGRARTLCRSPLCVSAMVDGQTFSDVSVALGNVALTDHGRTLEDEGLEEGKCANLSWKLKRLQTLWFDGIGRNNIKPVRERSRDEESVTFGEKTQEEASTG